MEDGMDVPYYRVKVKAIFTAFNVEFMPGFEYEVTDAIYHSQLPNGQNFADLCDSAAPFTLTVPD
jgi:hypothetical protein